MSNTITRETPMLTAWAKQMDLVELQASFLLLQMALREKIQEANAEEDFQLAHKLGRSLEFVARGRSELS